MSVSALEAICDENIRAGAASPFNAVIDLQRYASTLALSSMQPPAVTISDDRQHITYKDKTLDIEKWIQGLDQLYNDAKAELDGLLMGLEPTLTIPDFVADDMSNASRGYSWLNNPGMVKDRVLLEHLIATSSEHVCFMPPNTSEVQFNIPFIKKFMARAASFNGQLALLCQMVAGQPTRITEFVEAKIRNSVRPRELFRAGNCLWLVTRRVKSENIKNKESFIPRKLPPRIQFLADVYLLVVRPLEVDFSLALWDLETATLYYEFFFVAMGERLDPRKFQRLLKAASSKYFGCEVGPREYRQLIVAAARVYLGSEYTILEEDEEEAEFDALAEQAGHTAMLRRKHYAVEIGMLPALSSDLLDRFGRVSEWWWRLVRFHPDAAPLLPLNQRQTLRNVGQQSSSTGLETTGEVPGDITLRLEQQFNKLSAELVAGFNSFRVHLDNSIQKSVATGVAEAMSRLTHQPLLMPQNSAGGAPLVPNVPMSGLAPIQDPPHDVQMVDDLDDEGLYAALVEPITLTPSVAPNPSSPSGLFPTPSSSKQSTTLDLLRQFYPDKTVRTFRSPQQEELVRLSLERSCNLICILPTGGGKSLSFLLPALIEEDLLTVVIISNRSLLVDMIRRTDKLGIPVHHWTAQRHETPDEARIVYLALESATSITFRRLYSIH